MVHIAIEYVILIPLLVLQIFLFPLTASWLTNVWGTSSQTIALQQVASQVGTSIQQLYISLNHTTIESGTVKDTLYLPSLLSGYTYTGNATLVPAPGSASNVLHLTLKYIGAAISTTTLVPLGQNAQWQNSSFMSNSTSTSINGNKDNNGIIWLSFGT